MRQSGVFYLASQVDLHGSLVYGSRWACYQIQDQNNCPSAELYRSLRRR
jgi:hypothetical protein